MSQKYLHERKDFGSLIRTLASETGILDALIEKDYWIMHVLHSMKKLDLQFELKGGTSLSKGYRIIDRFSEDIDLHISPPKAFIEETGIIVNENPKATKPKQMENRRLFFDWLANNIRINGITKVVRDIEFDDERYRSGGIRLKYNSFFAPVNGLKDGILLEAGFAKVTPNTPVDISSWMYERAVQAGLDIADNQAISIACYHPGYTLVEKLQTIVTKFRKEQELEGSPKVNFMRQYYDVYQLLQRKDIQDFIGTKEYNAHKQDWFPEIDQDLPLKEKEALLLSDPDIRSDFSKRFKASADLYYRGQPDFDEMIKYIHGHLDKL